MARPNTIAGGRPPAARNRAEQWLTDMVVQGEQPAVMLKVRGHKEGFSYGTLRNAKDKLGLLSVRKGRIWYWAKADAVFELTPLEPKVLTAEEVEARTSEKVAAWMSNTDSPWTQDGIEREATTQFQKVIFLKGATVTFDSVLTDITETVRSYDNPDIVKPFTDERIREFIIGVLKNEVERTDEDIAQFGIKNPEAYRAAMRKMLPAPTPKEQAATMSQAQIEVMLPMFDDVVEGTDFELKQAMQERLKQLKNDQAF